MEEQGKVYIERQKKYTKRRGSYGPTGSISANGCGAVAVYNVLVHFGIPIDFMTIVRRFHLQWPVATSFGGCMGTLVTHIIWELKQYNLRVRPILFTRKTMKRIHLDDNTAMIFLYFWKKNRRLGGHYQAVFGKRYDFSRAVSLNETLMCCNIEIDGRLHDGLDDAVNTAKIIKLLETEKDFKLYEYEKEEVEEQPILNFCLGDLCAGLQFE